MSAQERLDRAIEAILKRYKDSGIGQTAEFKELSQSYTEIQDPGDVAST